MGALVFMGTYTNNFKLYKPIPDEVIDVNQQVNYNWDITDDFCKRLLEYQYFTGPSIGDTVGATNKTGERWYKTYSNAIIGASAPGAFIQDTFAHVDTWVDATSLITTVSGLSWQAFPNFPPAYRVISSPGSGTTEIEWVGRLWVGGGAIQSLVSYAPVITGMPVATRPAVGKYFQLYAGNTTSDYAVARALASSNGDIQFQKYGNGAATSNLENYIDLGGMRYNVEVPA